ncbi:GumC family protein [Pontibacter populi]|uniref:non-specific protein-tyrosine kinase n=1 Tax=Pontibacter populi TaxID=890055 RepID=A0ABV1RX29_9BACT
MEARYIIHSPSEKPESNDFKALLSKCLSKWYLFVLGLILCFGLAYFYIMYATPKYRIGSTILLKSDEKGNGISSNVSDYIDLDIISAGKNIDDEIEVLKSKTLMKRVLTELSLQTSFFKDGYFKKEEIYGKAIHIKVYIFSLDSAAYEEELTFSKLNNKQFTLGDSYGVSTYNFGDTLNTSYGKFKIVRNPQISGGTFPRKLYFNFNSIELTADKYNQDLIVEPVNNKANVIRITLIEAVPQKGKDIINKLIEVYNKEALEDKNLVAANSMQFVDERLKDLTLELSNIEKNVENYKRQNKISDINSQTRLYLESASENNKKLAEWGVQIDVLESIERYLAKPGNQNKLVPSTLSIEDPTLLELISKFNELQLERNQVLRTASQSNFIVLTLDERLSGLRSDILENLSNIKRSLVITRDNLASRSGNFNSKIQQVPLLERELVDISRQQETKQELYLYLLKQREEAALTLAANVSNARIIDPALVELEPVEPKSNMIFLLAAFLGLGLPFSFIYLSSLLNNKVQQVGDIEEITATPILGEIAHNAGKDSLVVREHSRTAISEHFRYILSNLKAIKNTGSEVIVVTSSMSGEGKTFFSLNLAASLVMTGKKVLLMEFDLRNPKLLQALGLSFQEGISDYINTSDQVSIHEYIHPTGIDENLFVIGAGAIPSNPTKMMMSEKIRDLIIDLRSFFDYVIIDTAPVGQVADAFNLAPYIDLAIYLARVNYTYKEQLKLANDVYENKKFNNMKIVLNDVKVGNKYGYGYGYGYSN